MSMNIYKIQVLYVYNIIRMYTYLLYFIGHVYSHMYIYSL